MLVSLALARAVVPSGPVLLIVNAIEAKRLPVAAKINRAALEGGPR